ncbi:NADH dehydrogenase [ubiquinone] 1 alpha subcomplex subunit 1-like [Gigantopelta aegis]|uniref:NADH dehydrogenase [ubiquinone] 1 alpha subcomplex subunit 1-like n=1 Tax=Gigantopelta aegis TaxID=1735272 RepID=UPI001B888C0F|nr:NADH dehydrogenase [ubiquinone] 1 alpha subcomplex subunit 1-like [Gigantopelta aegis]
MWYEILPSAGIVFACLYAPHVINYGLNRIFRNGKTVCRDWEAAHNMDWPVYLRDKRITGSEYKPRGLESIPDKVAK